MRKEQTMLLYSSHLQKKKKTKSNSETKFEWIWGLSFIPWLDTLQQTYFFFPHHSLVPYFGFALCQVSGLSLVQ